MNRQFIGNNTIMLQKQPIESAPRDGTVILIWFGQDGACQARYNKLVITHPWEFIDVKSDKSLFVNCAIDGPGGPSHWAPFPR